MCQGHSKQKTLLCVQRMVDTYCGWSVSCEASKEQRDEQAGSRKTTVRCHTSEFLPLGDGELLESSSSSRDSA